MNEQDLVKFVNGADKSGRCIEHLKENMDINTFSTVSNPAVQKDQGALNHEVWNDAVHPAANDFDAFRRRKNSSCGQSIYAREKRVAGAPTWGGVWTDDGAYFWPSDRADAFETRAWRFTYRSGAVAIGDEPLEFFSDWDSDSESGDVCEALPACRASHVLMETSLAESLVDGGVPEGAMQFNDGVCAVSTNSGLYSNPKRLFVGLIDDAGSDYLSSFSSDEDSLV